MYFILSHHSRVPYIIPHFGLKSCGPGWTRCEKHTPGHPSSSSSSSSSSLSDPPRTVVLCSGAGPALSTHSRTHSLAPPARPPALHARTQAARGVCLSVLPVPTLTPVSSSSSSSSRLWALFSLSLSLPLPPSPSPSPFSLLPSSLSPLPSPLFPLPLCVSSLLALSCCY